VAAVLAVCCVCCGPYRLLCGGGVPCGGKHIIIRSLSQISAVLVLVCILVLRTSTSTRSSSSSSGNGFAGGWFLVWSFVVLF